MTQEAIGLDLDGVLYPWHEAVYNFYVCFRDYKDTFTQFWSSYYKSFTDSDWNFLINVDVFYSCISPSKSVVEFLSEVSKHYNIYYISSRPESVQLATDQFLKRYKFPFYENLIFSSDKASYARLYQLKYFVDDLPEQVEELSKVTNTIMYARPYNKEYQKKYCTARSYSEVLKLMEIR
jgi:5'(3')-deoxyribonucleotidase